MEYRVGGFAKPRGNTKAFKKLPINSGDFNPANLVKLDPNALLFLAEFKVRTEPSEEDPKVKVKYVMWRVMVGEAMLWMSEEAMREPRRDEIPQEAWASCGI